MREYQKNVEKKSRINIDFNANAEVGLKLGQERSLK